MFFTVLQRGIRKGGSDHNLTVKSLQRLPKVTVVVWIPLYGSLFVGWRCEVSSGGEVSHQSQRTNRGSLVCRVTGSEKGDVPHIIG